MGVPREELVRSAHIVILQDSMMTTFTYGCEWWGQGGGGMRESSKANSQS